MQWKRFPSRDSLDSLEMEAEAHESLLRDKWKQLFDQADPEGFGEIMWEDFLVALVSPEFAEQVDSHKQAILTAKAWKNGKSAITFDEFVHVMSGKRSRSFKIAVHEKDREVHSDCELELEVASTRFGALVSALLERMVRRVAKQYLPEQRDRNYYADHYRCCPPPLFLIIVTLLELSFFAYYLVTSGAEVSSTGPVPIESIFIYRPDKRQQLWRFFLYMLLHAGWIHLFFNLLVQVLIGLPLEMVHGSLRIGTIYMAGVLAGSLGTSVFDSKCMLVGASGGVYALLAAHLANVVLNYNQMELGILRIVGVFIIASADVGFAIYDRYAKEETGPISYVAHLAGALAGLTIGLLVLKNFEQKLHQQFLWWVSLGVYAACLLFAFLFNVFN